MWENGKIRDQKKNVNEGCGKVAKQKEEKE
jgi:hypothetical protein